MQRLLVRRSVTAVGIYSSVALGFLTTVVVAREFHSLRLFGDYSTVLFATALLQTFFDLTVEEALVKYGFRYVTREEWGRLRRLFESALAFKLVGSLLGGFGLVAFAFVGPRRLEVALLLAAGIPLGQSLEGLSGVALFLRSRYDIRSLFLGWSMALRLLGVGVGARYGLDEAVGGLLAAQVASTLSVAAAGRLAFRRFPRAKGVPLGDDRRGLLVFVAQSSAATGVLSLRNALAPLLLGAVTSTAQVGAFKVAQSPQSGFQALSAPARMVLLTEQTREWERGHQSLVLRGVRRYSLVALVLSLAVVPVLWIWIGDLIRWIYTAQYVGATNAARLLLLAAAIQLVVGWTKSFPVSIGRPGLRVVTHGVETVVVLPLVIVLGLHWGAAGAAGAVLAGVAVFAGLWAAIFARIRPEDLVPPVSLDESIADAESEVGVIVR